MSVNIEVVDTVNFLSQLNFLLLINESYNRTKHYSWQNGTIHCHLSHNCLHRHQNRGSAVSSEPLPQVRCIVLDTLYIRTWQRVLKQHTNMSKRQSHYGNEKDNF